MTSLKELQQVCANVLKEFHQVGRYLSTYSCSPTSSQCLVYKKTNHTPCKQHVLHLYINISSKKIHSQKIKPIYRTKIQVTNTFDDKVGNFSKNLRMEFRSVSQKLFVCKFCLTERSDFHLNFVRVFCVSRVMEQIILSFRETKDDMVKKIDEHVQLAIQDSR